MKHKCNVFLLLLLLLLLLMLLLLLLLFVVQKIKVVDRSYNIKRYCKKFSNFIGKKPNLVKSSSSTSVFQIFRNLCIWAYMVHVNLWNLNEALKSQINGLTLLSITHSVIIISLISGCVYVTLPETMLRDQWTRELCQFWGMIFI